MRFGTINKMFIILISFSSLFLSCNGVNKKLTVEEKIYEWLDREDYESVEETLGITVNSGTRKTLKKISIDSVEYGILVEDGKLKIIFAYDDDFKTEEGFSKKTKVSKLLKKTGQELWVEPGVCVFVPLGNDWMAVVNDEKKIYSVSDKNSSPYIVGFTKQDPEFSRSMKFSEWKQTHWYK